MYVYDTKTFSWLQGRGRREKGDLNLKATPTMLLKTHVEKMSVLATPTIFMKTRDLSRYSHDIYENKGSCASGRTDRKQRMRDEKGDRPMSRESESELTSAPANEMNAATAPGGSTPEAGVTAAVLQFRQREQKRNIKYTFEAGMCMKTKEHKTQCPNRNRHLGLNFRHLRRTEIHFAENWCFWTTTCQINSVFHGSLHCGLRANPAVCARVTTPAPTAPPLLNQEGSSLKLRTSDGEGGAMIRRGVRADDGRGRSDKDLRTKRGHDRTKCRFPLAGGV